MTRTLPIPAFARQWLPLWLLTAAAYVALGKICVNLGTLVGTASPFWLPAGLVTALALQRGYRVLPGVFLGQMLVGMLFASGPLWPYLAMASGNVLEGAAIAWLCPRLMRTGDVFASVGDFFAFFAAALVGSSLNALLGASALYLAGFVPAAAFGHVMLDWSIGDLGGTLIIAPLLLSLRHFRRDEWQDGRLAEYALVLLASCGLAYAIFSGQTRLPSAPLAFVLLPCLLWTAFRFGPVSCAVNNALLMSIVIWGTTRGHGPFVAATATDALVLLQLFTSVLIVTALLALIVNRDRQRMTETLRSEASQLEAKVEQRTHQLQDATRAAEAASRAKSEFLASMSHELRTPLNAILGFAQLFEMDPDLSAEGREHAGEILRAGQHLLALVNDLIDLARIENGRMQLAVEPVDARSVISESIDMVTAFAARHDITLIPRYDTAAEAALLTDRSRLHQVLINLLTNAIKYNRPRGSVTIASALNDGQLRISVTDTGPGIPLADQERIFNPFDRLGREGGTIEGTGIGLVICKRIVEALGGGIGFESMEDQGTTFWVEFPAVTADSLDFNAARLAHAERAALRASPAAPDAATRVLLAEDNLVNQRLAVALLNTLGYAVDVVSNGEAAVSAAAERPYGAILMDCLMPEMDGYQATAAIREAELGSGRHIPIIAVTANAMHGDRERCLAVGMDDYLPKPISLESLRTTLTRWLPLPAEVPNDT